MHGARRAWERRGLTVWRDDARGTLRLTVELPIEEGELIARAIDCAVAAGEVVTDVEPGSIAEPMRGVAWRVQQADALVAVARAYLDGGGAANEQHYLDAHHLQHWATGGETVPDNLTLLCTYHHRQLHEGGFQVERERDGKLTFTRADGRVIPRFGYRVEDFTDDVEDAHDNASAEGFLRSNAPDARATLDH